MASGARRRTDVVRGCDAALRPRGRAVCGPRKAQEAHRARTRGRRPHVSMRVCVGARVGCHVAGEVGRWRAHELVGPGLEFGAVTQMRYCAPPFNLNVICVFFSVGLCSHTASSFGGDVARRHALDAIRTARIAWTRVHAIIKSGTCAKDNLSDAIKGLTLGHVVSRESLDHHKNEDRAIAI